MHEKFKSFLGSDQTFYSILVVLVGFLGYLLGGGSVVRSEYIQAPASLPIESKVANPDEAGTVMAAPKATTGLFVAAKSGSKYHLLTCPGAKQIKDENKVFFPSAVAAEAAGYKPASNCPDLVQ